MRVSTHVRGFYRWQKLTRNLSAAVGLNYGALIAVAAVALIGNFLFLLVERRREEKEMKQQQKDEQ